MGLVKKLALIGLIGTSFTGLESTLKADEQGTNNYEQVHQADGAVVERATTTYPSGNKYTQEREVLQPIYGSDASKSKQKIKRNKFGVDDTQLLYRVQLDDLKRTLSKHKGTLSSDLQKEVRRVYVGLIKQEVQTNGNSWTLDNNKYVDELCSYGLCEKDVDLLVRLSTYGNGKNKMQKKLFDKALKINDKKARTLFVEYSKK